MIFAITSSTAVKQIYYQRGLYAFLLAFLSYLFPMAKNLPDHLITQTGVTALINIILHLAKSDAPEIYEQAHDLLPKIDTLHLSQS